MSPRPNVRTTCRHAFAATFPLCAALALAAAPWGSARAEDASPKQPKVLRFAAGPEGSLYQEVARAISKAVHAKHPGIRIDVLRTGGSTANAEMIAEGNADLAIVQSNIAGEYLRPNPDVAGLVSLYNEAIHIFGLGDDPPQSVDDLRRKRVYIGESGSGTKDDAKRLLNALRIYATDFDAVVAPFADLPQLIAQHKVDAGILVDGVPARQLTRLEGQFRPVPLASEEVKDLLSSHDYLAKFDIPANSYHDQHQAVPTVGVRALLVCRSSLDSATVRDVLSAIANAPELRTLATKYGEMVTPLNQLRRGMSLELHPEAASFFRGRVIMSSLRTEMLPDVLLLVALVIAWLVVLLTPARWARYVRRNIYAQLIGGFLSIYILATVIIHVSEYGTTPGFDSLGQSFWSSVVYVLSGLDTNEPSTLAGRIGLAILLVAGAGMFGSITGKFASMFMNYDKYTMPRNTSRHILICNWNTRADALIRELHSPEAEPDAEIIVLCANEVPNEKQLREQAHAESQDPYSHVFFVHSNPESYDALKSVRVHLAKSVVILVDEHSPDPDASTALVALAIRRTCQDQGVGREEQPRIVAETSNHRKIRHIKDAGADEIVCPSDFGLGVLAQCCLNGHISEVYNVLLHYSAESSEIYVVEGDALPSGIVGRTFHEISMAVLALPRDSNPCIPIGIRRKNGETIVNPRGDEGSATFQEGDAVIAIAFTTPDLSNMDLSKLDFAKAEAPQKNG